jgi:hypothetical protein
MSPKQHLVIRMVRVGIRKIDKRIHLTKEMSSLAMLNSVMFQSENFLQPFLEHISLFSLLRALNLHSGVVDTEQKRQFPGVDVMIIIFCDCCQFSAKKLAFFSKTEII